MQWSEAATCPLNVCCSEFGFCGMTESFCAGKYTPKPECPLSQATSDKRTVGYYEGWNFARPCGNMPPNKIPLGYYTHLNFAFALVHPQTFHVVPMDEGTGKLYSEVTNLKARQRGLQVWLAIGGWAMNDEGPYRHAFSNMAKSDANQDAFFESLITLMFQHNFDGVDIDWEVRRLLVSLPTFIVCLFG